MNGRESFFDIVLTSFEILLLMAGIVGIGIAFGGLSFANPARLGKTILAAISPICIGASLGTILWRRHQHPVISEP